MNKRQKFLLLGTAALCVGVIGITAMANVGHGFMLNIASAEEQTFNLDNTQVPTINAGSGTLAVGEYSHFTYTNAENLDGYHVVLNENGTMRKTEASNAIKTITVVFEGSLVAEAAYGDYFSGNFETTLTSGVAASITGNYWRLRSKADGTKITSISINYGCDTPVAGVSRSIKLRGEVDGNYLDFNLAYGGYTESEFLNLNWAFELKRNQSITGDGSGTEIIQQDANFGDKLVKNGDHYTYSVKLEKNFYEGHTIYFGVKTGSSAPSFQPKTMPNQFVTIGDTQLMLTTWSGSGASLISIHNRDRIIGNTHNKAKTYNLPNNIDVFNGATWTKKAANSDDNHWTNNDLLNADGNLVFENSYNGTSVTDTSAKINFFYTTPKASSGYYQIFDKSGNLSGADFYGHLYSYNLKVKPEGYGRFTFGLGLVKGQSADGTTTANGGVVQSGLFFDFMENGVVQLRNPCSNNARRLQSENGVSGQSTLVLGQVNDIRFDIIRLSSTSLQIQLFVNDQLVELAGNITDSYHTLVDGTYTFVDGFFTDNGFGQRFAVNPALGTAVTISDVALTVTNPNV